jgi:hypothetical protein
MSKAFLRTDGDNAHATTETDGRGQHARNNGDRRTRHTGRGRAKAGRVGETRRRLAQTAHLKAKPPLSLSLSLSLSRSCSRSRSLATLVTPTMSTPVQDNISLIPSRLCSILHEPIWAGARSDKFTGRLTILAGPKCRQTSIQKYSI